MARKPKPKPPAEPAKSYDEFPDDSESTEDDASSTIEPTEVAASNARARDWRDVERLKEMRELRRMVGDDLDFDDEPRRR